MSDPATILSSDIPRRAARVVMGAIFRIALWTVFATAVLGAVSLWTLHAGIRGENLPGYLKILQGMAIVPLYFVLGLATGLAAGIASAGLKILSFIREALTEILRPWATQIAAKLTGEKGEISLGELRSRFREMAARTAAPDAKTGLLSHLGARCIEWGLLRSEAALSSALFGRKAQDPSARVGPALIEEAVAVKLPGLVGRWLRFELTAVFWLSVGTALAAVLLPVWLIVGRGT